MKKNHYVIASIVLCFSYACTADIEVVTPKFDVTLRNATVKVGEPVFFDIKDYDAEQVNFYSGEEYHEYDYSLNKRYLINPGMTLSFNVSKQMGTQLEQLKVLVSTNFNNDLEPLNITDSSRTEWTDITNKFSLPVNNSTAYVSAGTVDISSLMIKGNPFHVAFKYVQQPQVEFGATSLYAIQNLMLRTTESVGGNKMTVFNQSEAIFRLIDLTKDVRASRSYIDTRLCYLLGPLLYNSNSEFYDVDNLYWNDPASEVWAISENLNVDSVDVGYDMPLPIINITDPTNIKAYLHHYTKPGTYKAVFVAKRSSVKIIKEEIKKFTVTVLPN